MQFPAAVTAGRIAELVGGELVGHDDIDLAGIASLESAGPGDLTFVSAHRYLKALRHTKATAALLPDAFRSEPAGCSTLIIVEEPLLALRSLINRLVPSGQPDWAVHATATIGHGTRWKNRITIARGAVIGSNVSIGADCTVGEHAVIEDDVVIGDACAIDAHATIHRGAVLHDRVAVRSGARVGGPGFGFVRAPHGHARIPQAGTCHIHDDVDIGANSTVDRGSIGDTVIGAGTKIDNLVHVAHNVRVGTRCIIMAQVGIAGSTVVGDDVMLAGQAGLADHLTVGAGARVAAQSGVIGDVPAGSTVSGYPARDHRSVLRQAATLSRLTPLVTTLERMIDRHE